MKKTTPFTLSQLNLTNQMLSNPKAFDTNNNCFKLAARGIAEALELSSHTTVVRQIKRLKEYKYAKQIEDLTNQSRLMIDPEFFYKGSESDRHFINSVYILNSFKKALELDLLQREIGYNLDPRTGQWVSPYDYTTQRPHNTSLFPSNLLTDDAVYQRFLDIKNS
ncbi:hypothetical protein [Vibrio parahaemolyticus]|uniref:hypothetical protein n=1 Tax=Vibrio parahaemolyticus TaxID=670 RepID=UPI0005F20A90|nr:hypothetical protein [Vibrio parahaemolyticus]KJR15251.1 hypothetical protein UF28_16430 [Vibrio parahaemolyticus]